MTHFPSLLPSSISRNGPLGPFRGIILLFILALWLQPAPILAQSEDMPRQEQKALHRAQKLLSKDSADECLAELRRFRKKHGEPESALFHLVRGNALYSQKEYQKAEKAYSRGLDKAPDHPALLRNLASVCLRTGDPHRAGRLYRRAHEASEEPDPELLYHAGAAFYRAKAHERAFRALSRLFDQAGEIEPRWAELLVYTCLEAERWTRAERALDRLLEENPEQRRYWKLLAQVRLKQGQNRKAACALEIAYDLDAPDSSGWKNLANIYASAGAPLQAARTLEKACGETCSVKDLQRLARLYSRACRHDSAMEHLDRALKQEPSADLYLEKGRLCYRAGEFRQARVALEKALDRNPENNEARLWLGYAAWQLRDWDLARRSFDRVPRDGEHGKQAENGLQSVLAVIEAQDTGKTLSRKGG
ncbi:MAG: tetratricopeptide repeat protein [Desulfohalobiaceae bacterium]